MVTEMDKKVNERLSFFLLKYISYIKFLILRKSLRSQTNLISNTPTFIE